MNEDLSANWLLLHVGLSAPKFCFCLCIIVFLLTSGTLPSTTNNNFNPWLIKWSIRYNKFLERNIHVINYIIFAIQDLHPALVFLPFIYLEQKMKFCFTFFYWLQNIIDKITELTLQLVHQKWNQMKSNQHYKSIQQKWYVLAAYCLLPWLIC